MTKLQRNLYKILVQNTDMELFNSEYDKLIETIQPEQRHWYTKGFIFRQGDVKGTPDNLPFNSLVSMIKEAGYKDPHSDRAWNSYHMILNEVFCDLIGE